MVKRFDPYFETETTIEDFEEEYLDDLYAKILESLNEKLSEGFLLPLKAALPPEQNSFSLFIYNDYLLLEDELPDEVEEKSPEKLKQSFLDVDAKERARYKPIYNYKSTQDYIEGDTKSDDGNKDD